MKNARGAGRKPKLTGQQYQELKARRESGEEITVLAAEYGISRQALYQRFRKEDRTGELRLDYMAGEELVTIIYADTDSQTVRIRNYTEKLSKTAFGWKDHPDWEDLHRFLEENVLAGKMPGKTQDVYNIVCDEVPKYGFSLSDLPDHIRIAAPEKDVFPAAGSGSRKSSAGGNTASADIRFSFSRRDILYSRTDTDGFQMKALSSDRRWFVKSQAVMAGKQMNDWMVEVIASDLCRQLEIPHVEQQACRLYYEGRPYMGVYSRNFELDGYTFISFERLLERMGKSSRDEKFIRSGAAGRLQWCAGLLAEAGDLPYEQAEKYMLDMALLDCLVGNVDRHTRNFGLFFHAGTGKHEIPPVFDNGMGFFEHDYYRDTYQNFEEAMRTVYIGPYDEDPFDLLKILHDRYDLGRKYPALKQISYMDFPLIPAAKDYQEKILALVCGEEGRLWQR